MPVRLADIETSPNLRDSGGATPGFRDIMTAMPQVRYRNIVADSARWEGFELRPDDIIISTPPKCGTTWTQMLVALIVFDEVDLSAPMDEISPWLDQSLRSQEDIFRALDAQRHRRFIKTHTPLDGLPWDDHLTYLCVGRDPRDVSLSWDHHLENMDTNAFIQARADAVGLDDLGDFEIPGPPPDDPADRFRLWVDAEDTIGIGVVLASLLNHLRGFWQVRDQPNVHLFHYADYQADLVGEMERLAEALRIDRNRSRLEELAPAARFDAMKARAADFAPNSSRPIWKDTTDFFHRGGSGSWRDIGLTDDDFARYAERVAALVPPDLAAWLHEGRRGTSGLDGSPKNP